MIVVLSCSTGWCRNRVSRSCVEPDTIPSTGGVEQTDSLVTIPISYIKLANRKLIQLKYEQEINANLTQVIKNDSIIIEALTYELDNCIRVKDQEVKKVRRQRNILFCTTIGAGLISLLLLLK